MGLRACILAAVLVAVAAQLSDQLETVSCSGDVKLPADAALAAMDASAPSNNATESAQAVTCSSKAPPRRTWKPKEPRGPDSEEGTPRVYNNALNVHVIFTKPADSAHHEAYERALRSATVQGLPVTSIATSGFSGEAIAQEVEKFAQDPNAVILYLGQSEDVIIADEQTELLHKFQDLEGKIVFGVSKTCFGLCNLEWPRAKPSRAPRFLHPHNFIGYASAVAQFLKEIPAAIKGLEIPETERLNALFLKNDTRESLGIVLDYRSEIFQDLAFFSDDMADSEFSIDFTFRGRADTKIFSGNFGTYPSVVRGSGNTKLLNQIGNYVPLAWTEKEGCVKCQENLQCISATSDASSFPTLYVSLVVPSMSPYLEVVLKSFAGLVYPKEKMTLQIHLDASDAVPLERNINITKAWVAEHKTEFAKISLSTQPTVARAHAHAVETAAAQGADYALFTDTHYRFVNNETLISLLRQNRTVIAPLAFRHKKLFSNFWGATIGDLETSCKDDLKPCATWAEEGECESNAAFMKANCMLSCGVCQAARKPWSVEYKRSFDYIKIVQGDRVGVWAVPLVSGAVLVRGHALPQLAQTISKDLAAVPAGFWPAYTVLSHSLRADGHLLHISNLESYGHLIDPTDYPTDRMHPELYLVRSNLPEWIELYLHKNYSSWTNLDMAHDSIDGHVCTDIYNFPFLTERFCSDFIEEAEYSNEWSTGDVSDKRLKGGYEPVPTRDIHFDQIDFKKPFFEMLHEFVAPITAHHYIGYSMSAKQNLDFIVKYQPEGQAFLRPHHDASTVTMVVALNRRGVDFEGGGTRFTRQNCTVYSPVGHATLHPGRLTHQHEGLQTTKGTRYIMVTFIDQ